MCGKCLGLALSPCGVESSCDTLPRAGLVLHWSGPLFGCFLQVLFYQKQWCVRCFSVCIGIVKCALIYFCENRSRLCFVFKSCYFLVVYTGESPEATTSSRFFIFFFACTRLVLCSTQGRGALMAIISSPRRSLMTGFEPRSGSRGRTLGSR